jgi:hypothetical protein
MRPPTPAMLQTLRLLGWRMRSGEYLFASLRCHHSTQRALLSRGWIVLAARGDCWEWQLTPEGRRVLAEHTTGDE